MVVSYQVLRDTTVGLREDLTKLSESPSSVDADSDQS